MGPNSKLLGVHQLYKEAVMDEMGIAFKLHEQINFYWHFYVPSTIALLGWIFAGTESWPWNKRIALSVAFAGFVVFNLLALIKSYTALEAVVNELRSSSVASALNTDVLTATISRLDMGPWEAGIVFHLLLDFGVLYLILIWSGRKIAT